MPFIVKPIEEIKSIEIQPHIDKMQNAEVDSTIALYLIFAFVVSYLFRGFLFGLVIFLFKLIILAGFIFVTYTLFLT